MNICKEQCGLMPKKKVLQITVFVLLDEVQRRIEGLYCGGVQELCYCIRRSGVAVC